MSEQMTRQQLIARIEELSHSLYELRKHVGGGHRSRLPRGRFNALVCRIDQDKYALPLDSVEEVTLIARLSKLPEAPYWIPGLLNLRGETLVVIDGTSRLTQARRRTALQDLIIICNFENGRVGLIVQEIFDVVTLEADEIHRASEDVPSAPYLFGVVHAQDEAVLLLDLPQLIELSDVPENEQ